MVVAGRSRPRRVCTFALPDEEWWLDVARRSDHATFFHTPLWARLARAVHPDWHDATRAAVLPSGTRAVFPLLEVGHAAKGTLPRLVSAAFGCYGGPVTEGPLDPDELRSVYRTVLAGRIGRLSIVENPLAPFPDGLSSFREREGFTDILPLGSDPEPVFARFTKTRRYETRKGRAAGVRTRPGASLEDYRTYFDAYEDSLRRWGERTTSRYPWQLFEAGHSLALEHPEYMTLWLAEVEGTVVAGAWIFYWNRHAVYWHGAAHESAFPVHATSVLLADAIEDACRRGLAWFDFNPSGSHEGVAAFKRSFGTERRSIRSLSYEHPLLRRLRAVKAALP